MGETSDKKMKTGNDMEYWIMKLLILMRFGFKLGLFSFFHVRRWLRTQPHYGYS